MAFFSTTPRTTVRNGSGPRAVDGSNPSRRNRGGGRRHSKGEDNDKHRPKRKDSYSSQAIKDGHRQKATSTANAPVAPARVEQPTLELTVVRQPAHGIQLGVPVHTAVVVSLRTPPSAQGIRPDRVDTSRFFGLTSLMSDRGDGERVPLEAGSLTGQKTYDSVQDMRADSIRTFERLNPNLVVLGYFSFSGLIIRQAGTFRIRTTLARMGAEGASSLVVVDSEPVKVERRTTVTSSQRQ